jgi:hypothetical protein
MNKDDAINVINNMNAWAKNNNISLLMVGSVAYRSALLRNSEFENCDDMDCIFIYDDFSQIEDCEFFDEHFYKTVCDTIFNKADMFTIKTTIEGIKISADFVSGDYLKNLAAEKITGVSKYRRKLTNAIEVPDNVYTNFYGQKTTYHKVWEEYQEYRIYKLPIHLFVDTVFFPGVLLSKYLFNPTFITINDDHKELIQLIQKNAFDYCPAEGSWSKAYYKCSSFSDETKQFLKYK